MPGAKPCAHKLMALTTDQDVHPESLQEKYAEAQRYFMGQGRVNNTLAQLARDLKAYEIDYVVFGAVALFAHGYPRFTEDIDLIMTEAGLKRFQDELVGLGYVPSFVGARKRFRSTLDGVPIEIMLTGEYPGDGLPKPVSIPEPAAVATEIDGIRFVTIEKLIELKLASGISASDRLKDLADVQELIKIRALPREFAERLNPYVRAKYLELVESVEKLGSD